MNHYIVQVESYLGLLVIDSPLTPESYKEVSDWLWSLRNL